ELLSTHTGCRAPARSFHTTLLELCDSWCELPTPRSETVMRCTPRPQRGRQHRCADRAALTGETSPGALAAEHVTGPTEAATINSHEWRGHDHDSTSRDDHCDTRTIRRRSH